MLEMLRSQVVLVGTKVCAQQKAYQALGRPSLQHQLAAIRCGFGGPARKCLPG